MRLIRLLIAVLCLAVGVVAGGLVLAASRLLARPAGSGKEG
jgi:hypothetical protein